jgi:hypothetical protein
MEMGYNAAPWNLHERGHIKQDGNDYLMPDGTRLVFYHFSSYKYNQPDKIGRQYNRFHFKDFPELEPLYRKYHQLLLDNGIEQISLLSCYYVTRREELGRAGKNHKENARIMKGFLRSLTPPVIWRGMHKLLK